jgi:hypothetical protein
MEIEVSMKLDGGLRALLLVVALFSCINFARSQTSSFPFEFSAKVTKLGASSVSLAPQSNNTIVAEVLEIKAKPSAVAMRKGDPVTVRVNKPTDFKEGQVVVFRATPWIYGEGLALQEVSHYDPSGSAPAIPQEHLASLVASSDAAVKGQVTEIRPSASETGGIHGVSEHSAIWKDAIVQVKQDGALKGSLTGTVVVRFKAMPPGASVPDISFRDLPQFQAGETATFLLKKDTVSGLPKPTLHGGQVTAYVVQGKDSIQPIGEADRIRSIAIEQSRAPEK